MEKVLLCIAPVPGTSTADDLFSLVKKKELDEYKGIKIIAAITDGAPNMKNTCSLLGVSNL